MTETPMLPVPTIARRRALLGAAALAASVLAGALQPHAAHATIGGSRKDTVGGGRAGRPVAASPGHPAHRPGAGASGTRRISAR